MLKKTWKKSSTFQKAFSIFLLILLGRLFFSSWIGLIDDEAYHWSWTKDLSLSYFDHPGMVAWAEALSTWLLGDNELSVRLPSFLAYTGTILVSWRLAWDLFDEVAGYFVVALLLFGPLWGLAGYVASPEPFLMFFWILAAWIFWQGVRPDELAWSLPKTWIALGIVMGLGLNSKFLIAPLAPGFAIYLLTTRDHRKDLLSPWPWIGALIATLLCTPIFLWNYQTEWPGFRYQFHDRHQDGDHSFSRWLTWWAAQFALMSPAVYILQSLAFVKASVEGRDPRWRFIISLSIPSLLLFYIQPYYADPKPHWPGPAYLLLSLGAGALWSTGLQVRGWLLIKARSRAWLFSIFIFLVPLNLIFYSAMAYPWIPKAYRLLKPHSEWTTTWDFTNEFYGWDELGTFVNTRQRQIHADTGKRPFLAALRYETTAQTYWGTKQKVIHLSFTRSHYTISQNLTHELENLRGLDALITTTEKYPANPMEWGVFDSCTPEELKTYRGTEWARTFTIWWCRNFQGVRK